jgi:hypothetical protein
VQILPTALLVKFAENMFGPLIVARLTGLVGAEKRAQLAQRLPILCPTGVCVELDPRHART